MAGVLTETHGGGVSSGPLPDAVVFITNVSRGIIGGIAQYLDPLERILPGCGVRVETLQFPRALNLMESRGMPRVARATFHVGFALYCLLRLLRLHRTCDTIVVHSHGASYAMLTSLLAKPLGDPAIHTFHSTIGKPSLMLRLLAPKMDALVFVSEYLYHQLRTTSDLRGREIHYIPGGVDTMTLAPASPDERNRFRRAVLDRFGLADRGLLCLFIGRITPEKGVLELVEAAGHLMGLDTTTNFLIVGPSLDTSQARAYRELIERRIHELHLEDRVVLTGPMKHRNLRRMLAAADILACPSLSEASSISAVEAFACGIPVVASRVGGLTERVRHEESGLLVEPGNTSELAAAIDRLAKSPSLRARMAAEGRKDAIQLYGEDLLVEKHLRLYSRILKLKVGK